MAPRVHQLQSKVKDICDNLALRIFPKPRKFEAFWPFILPIGGRYITIHEDDRIDGDFSAFRHWLRHVDASRMTDLDRLSLLLLCFVWRDNEAKLDELRANPPRPPEVAVAEDNWYDSYMEKRRQLEATLIEEGEDADGGSGFDFAVLERVNKPFMGGGLTNHSLESLTPSNKPPKRVVEIETHDGKTHRVEYHHL